MYFLSFLASKGCKANQKNIGSRFLFVSIFVLLSSIPAFSQNVFPSTGSVGIGTITPDMKLAVFSDNQYIARFHHSGSSTISGFRMGRSGSYGDIINLSSGFGIGAGKSGADLPLSSQNISHIDFFISNTTGNVGIGETTPDMKLSVRSDNKNVARFHYTGSATVSGYRMGRSGSYVDFINLASGFGIGAGTSGSDLPLSSQNTSHIDFYIEKSSGKIGIGTTVPTEKLSVNGKINAEEIILEDVAGADFVFEEDYDLRSLEETEQFIKSNKHLPEVPSAAEMAEEGLAIKEMNILLLQKVEELTLHLIRMEKEMQEQIRSSLQSKEELLNRILEQEKEIQALKVTQNK